MKAKEAVMYKHVARCALRYMEEDNLEAIEAVSVACEHIHEPIPLDIRGMAENAVNDVMEKTE